LVGATWIQHCSHWKSSNRCQSFPNVSVVSVAKATSSPSSAVGFERLVVGLANAIEMATVNVDVVVVDELDQVVVVVHLEEGKRIASSYRPGFETELDDPVDEGEVIASPNNVDDEGEEKVRESIVLVEVVVTENGNENRPEREHDGVAGISIEILNHGER
jgi:hypothetical protein